MEQLQIEQSEAEADVDRAVALARDAFDNSPWPRLEPSERAAALSRLREVYAKRTAEMTEVVIAEMGSPRWFAELAQGPGGAAMLSTLIFPFVGIALQKRAMAEQDEDPLAPPMIEPLPGA